MRRRPRKTACWSATASVIGMSEILGDTDPDDDLLDETEEDDEFDGELDDLDRAIAASSWSATLTSPITLGIRALALAIVSLIGLLPSYLLVNSIALAHPASDSVFGVRVSALVQLGLGLLALLLAYVAHSGGPHRSRPRSAPGGSLAGGRGTRARDRVDRRVGRLTADPARCTPGLGERRLDSGPTHGSPARPG